MTATMMPTASDVQGEFHAKCSLRVAVADDESTVRDVLARMLIALGHQVVFTATTGRELVDRCQASPVDLVMTDIRMPDMDGLEAAKTIYQTTSVPVILLSGHCDDELIERAEASHVFAYLIKPISLAQMAPAIALAMRRCDEFRTLRQEAADLRQALADRKTIERAKGLMMKHLKVDEDEAFRKLQKLASSKNKKLVEIAEMVLTAAEALNG